MKTSKIIGKKVIDANANEIGKVSDIDINVEEYTVNKFFLSTGELSLRKVSYEITPEDINKIGDYLLLKINKSEIIPDKKDDNEFDVKIVDPSELEEKSSEE